MRSAELAARRAAARAREGARRAAGVLRAVMGVPDYGHYVAHLAERQPDARPMSRDEFVAARLRARYERPGSRCC
jgi:uncharacterized short protein YbdD (DUF466 family)